MRCVRILVSSLALIGSLAVSQVAAAADIRISLDQAKLEKIPEKVATLVVGNPLIADVAVQPGNLVVVTGKGYGTTNVIALDRAGNTLMEKSIEVTSPGGDVVTVYRGIERETYSCAPTCNRRITLGDSGGFFDSTLSQIGARNGAAQGAAPK